MRRLLILVLAGCLWALLPAAAAADAPFRANVTTLTGYALSEVAGACLGTEGGFEGSFDTFSANGRSTLFAHDSETSQQARIHGTVSGQLWTTLGASDAPHVYDGSVVVRFNDVVTPNPTNPNFTLVTRPVTVSMVPDAGGAPVSVAMDVQLYVQWSAPGTVRGLIPTFGLPSCG